VGENKAYFPTILLGYKQKVMINFGQENFFYSYKNYNNIDIPEGEFRNYLHVSKNLLEFVKNHYFSFLYEIKIPRSNIICLFSEIFLALSDITLEDELSIKEAFIPFLLAVNDELNIDEIMRNIYLTVRQYRKSDIFCRLMNCKFSNIFVIIFYFLQ